MMRVQRMRQFPLVEERREPLGPPVTCHPVVAYAIIET